jgi:hypothetical protein
MTDKAISPLRRRLIEDIDGTGLALGAAQWSRVHSKIRPLVSYRSKHCKASHSSALRLSNGRGAGGVPQQEDYDCGTQKTKTYANEPTANHSADTRPERARRPRHFFSYLVFFSELANPVFFARL